MNKGEGDGSGRRRVLTHRRVLCLVVVAILGLSLAVAESLSLDKSLVPLIPDSSPELARAATLLDLAPFSRSLAVQLTAEEPMLAGQLPEIADQLRARLDPDLMDAPSLADQIPDMAGVMAMLPALCDRECLARTADATRPERVRERLAKLKSDLAGADFKLTGFFWRVDPFELRGEVFKHFPRLTGLPQPDPVAGYPISPDGRRLLILIKPKVPMSDTEGCVHLMESLNTALTETLPAGVSVQIAGGHRHTAANAGAVISDLFVTLSLAMLLILAIYVFMVRSWGAIWLFITPAAAVLVATALLAVLYDRVSGLAIGFGAAVLGIAEDYAVHVHYALRHSPERRLAVRHVAKPLLMSVLLCAGGFGALLWSTVPAVRQLAAFTVLSIVAGYVWAMLVLPHCPGMDLPREAAASGTPLGLRRPRKAVVLGAAAFLTAFAAGLIATTPRNYSVRNLGFVNPVLQKDQEAIESAWGLSRGLHTFLVEGKNAEDALAMTGCLENALKERTPSLSAASLASLVPVPEAQQRHLREWDRFATERRGEFESAFDAAVREEGFAPKAFAPFKTWFFGMPKPIDVGSLHMVGLGFLTENFLAEKNGQTYAVLMVQGEPDPSVFTAGEYADRVTNLSAAGLERGISQALGRDRHLIPAAAIICLVVLLWAFKNVFFAFMAFIPALSGLAGVLIWLALSGRPLGLIEAAGLPLVVCLGADYGILVVNEFRERVDLGAVRAVLVSGLTTIAGIGILILARHPVLHTLGTTIFIGLFAAMAVSILLLPKFCLERES